MQRKPACDHPTFEASVLVNRVEDRRAFVVHVRCVVCGVRFRWLGVEAGFDYRRPMASPDGFELRAPIEPDAHLTSLMAGTESGFPTRPAAGPPHE